MSKKELQNDVTAAFAAGTDIILASVEVLPVAGKIVTILKSVETTRKTFLNKKIRAFWEDFQAPNVDRVLLAQVYSNLRSDFGADYFDEALFNAIEKSDSVKRTRMISRLVVLCSLKKIPQDEFWAILHVIQNLTMGDLMKTTKAIVLNDELQQSNNGDAVLNDYSKSIGISRLHRYTSVGIATVPTGYGAGGPARINVDFAQMVVAILES